MNKKKISPSTKHSYISQTPPITFKNSVEFVVTEDGGLYSISTIASVTPIVEKTSFFRKPQYYYTLMLHGGVEMEFTSIDLDAINVSRSILVDQLT